MYVPVPVPLPVRVRVSLCIYVCCRVVLHAYVSMHVHIVRGEQGQGLGKNLDPDGCKILWLEGCRTFPLPDVVVVPKSIKCNNVVCDQSPFYSNCGTHCNALQRTATHCSTLQHTATHRNTLQHTAAHCNTPQHTATHCHTLQRTATHCTCTEHQAQQCCV